MAHAPRLGASVPGSSIATAHTSRRGFLRGLALGGALLGAPGLMTACGGGSGSGGGGGGNTLKFGINEAAGSGPAYDRFKAMADAYAKQSGVKVELNAVDHNTFQESVNTYLQGSPDDVFTWSAGYRMAQLANNGLVTDISEVWPIDGMSDAFRAASSVDGKQYFVPISYYPWAVCYRKSVFEENNFSVPETYDDLVELMQEMQGKNITPFAYADKDGWPAMGTFDILNMRINGFDFHMSLMAGDEAWNSNEVRRAFEAWKELLPYHQADPLGRTWQEAATSLGTGDSGMYYFGTVFIGDAIPDQVEDIDFFNFPAMDDSIGSGALDAPIDGFCLAAGGPNQEAGIEMLKWLSTAEAADAANEGADAPFIAAHANASTDTYGELQKKSTELVGAAENFAQFLDRDTNSDFAATVVIPSLQDFLRNPGNINEITDSLQKQKESIF